MAQWKYSIVIVAFGTGITRAALCYTFAATDAETFYGEGRDVLIVMIDLTHTRTPTQYQGDLPSLLRRTPGT